MHLKSLMLRGFKSFASSTTLHFEPGITCVVGPNGSGKSNVVDALAWVLGEQGAKSLRGGKMEDVIFAGTSARPPLGRAEVRVSIDNSDGALPIEYAEVAITRTMFRGGGSEYAINGRNCRLLDVQELLSDSGIGREMHVVVGQGQLDAILHASPEERRGFVEEAAGVLKHRRRKDKAMRKLDATEANLTRLQDLLVEIRRQLKPLGRQAEVARRAAVVQADARDARARLLADDLGQAQTVLDRDLADEAALRARRADVDARLAQVRSREGELEATLRSGVDQLAQAQRTWYELSGLRGRLHGTAGLASERIRNLAEERDDAPSGRDPQALEIQAEQAGEEEEATAAELIGSRSRLHDAVTTRRRAEAVHVSEERRVGQLLRTAADHREAAARQVGQVQALRSRAGAAEEELQRLASAEEETLARAQRAQHDFTALEMTVASLDAGERGLDAEHEGAQSALHDLEDRLTKAGDEVAAADRDRSAQGAQLNALELALGLRDGAGALLGSGTGLTGLTGAVAELVRVRPGYEAAVAAALGPAADAVLARDLDCAVDALTYLKEHGLGRAGVIPGHDQSNAEQPLPAGGSSGVEQLIDGRPEATAALRRLLAGVVVVDDLAAARASLQRSPDAVVVTRAGDVLSRRLVTGGSAADPSLIEARAAVADAQARLDEARHRCERLRFELSRLEDERALARRRADVALAKLHESDAALAAVAEELGHLGSLARAASQEAARLTEAMVEVTARRDRNLVALAELEQGLADAATPSGEEPDSTELDQVAAAARAARQAELDARLALRTVEERGRVLLGRSDALRRAARAEWEAQERWQERRQRQARESDTAKLVQRAVAAVLSRLETSLGEAAHERSAIEAERLQQEARLGAVRSELRELDGEMDQLTDSVHHDELLRAEQRLRVEQLEQRARDELGLDVATLAAEFGPDQLVPTVIEPGQSAESPTRTTPYVREQQLRRLRSAENALALLGRVNPLALEEFSALEERHKFLSEQLEDVRKNRSQLLDIVQEVDDRVAAAFADAYSDTAREFAAVFARLFPGGEGRLVLSDPAELLTSGIDVEARPAGKSIKRLSLLSGGERSLVAAAFLVALFKARPSPFYILDEVEAALDDTNLRRLLEIYEELRQTSQLIVITHQKRTMEIADALYGVSMRGDGISTVISQRLRETEHLVAAGH